MPLSGKRKLATDISLILFNQPPLPQFLKLIFHFFLLCAMSRKSQQWSFVIPSFNDATINHLVKLTPDNVIYVTFAICDDDTCNRYLQGLVKTSRPCSINQLRRLVGNGIFSIATCVSDVLMDIQLKPSFVEIGETPFEKYRGEIASLKCAVNQGMHSIDELMQVHPYICTQYTRHILRYIHDITRSNSDTPETHQQIPSCA
jgi:hypothetical protein